MQEAAGQPRAARGHFRAWVVAGLILAAAIPGYFVAAGLRGKGRAGSDSSPGSPGEDPALASDARDRALRSEQLEVASRLLADFPASDDALHLVGLVHKEQGNWAEAVKCWKRALDLDPRRADTCESLGLEAMLREDLEKADGLFRKALALNPRLSASREHLGRTLIRQGRIREAAEVLEQNPENDPKVHRMLGEAWQQLKEYGKAKRCYEAAIAAKPDYGEAHYGLATTLARLGDEAGSRAADAAFQKLRVHEEQAGRRWRSSYDPYTATLDSVVHTHTDVARVYQFNGNRKVAEELWLRAAALDPQSPPCRMFLAALYEADGRHEEALRVREELARIDPNNALHHLALGNLGVRLGRLQRAEEAFRKVVELEPTRAFGHAALAGLYMKVNRNLQEARRLAETAVELEPSARNHAMLAQACAKSGDRTAALRAIGEALRLDPSNREYGQIFELLSKAE